MIEVRHLWGRPQIQEELSVLGPGWVALSASLQTRLGHVPRWQGLYHRLICWKFTPNDPRHECKNHLYLACTSEKV